MKKSVLDYALRVRLPITIVVILTSFVVTFYASKPERDGLGYSPDQPIKYSHKVHAGDMAIDCRYCHTTVEKSRHAGVPPASTCMNCHTVARVDKEEILKLTEFYKSGTPIPWKRMHKVPKFAYFNHSTHVNKGMDCAHCHGDIREMEKVSQVKSFTMAACLDCHRNPEQTMPELAGKVNKGPTYCSACHR